MRALKVLAACFGLVLGLLVLAVVTVVDWMWLSGPVRTNFAYVGDDTYSGVSVAIQPASLLPALAFPLAGAVLGWLVAVIAIRSGWRLSRGE
ncbi:hypothetical protein [Rhodococcus sp. (in: high G+C Gram-positive bacteria)]|uniref:hypothetical protein n=1 Tax=Rhodococcus sp. TaxID=1831 RepID=UPI003B8A70CD